MKRSKLLCTVVGSAMMMIGLAGLAQASSPQPEKKPDAKPTQPAKPATTPAAPAAKPAAPAQPDKKPALTAEDEAWMKAGTPGPEHRRLEKFVGHWEAESTFWMAEGAPPQSSKGEMHNTMVLDGRFLREEYSGKFNEMPFSGIGYFGYDNIQKKYVGTWMDSMGTGVMTDTGTFDEKTSTWTMLGSFTDPTGAVIKSRNLLVWTDNDHHSYTFYHTKGTDKEMKVGEIRYTRKGKAADAKPPAAPKPADAKPAAPKK